MCARVVERPTWGAWQSVLILGPSPRQVEEGKAAEARAGLSALLARLCRAVHATLAGTRRFLESQAADVHSL